MAILNYTTSVSARASVSEITALLVRKGAQSITTEYFPDGRVQAVSFIMRVSDSPVRFVLPANTEGVAGVMLKQNPWNQNRKCGRDAYTFKVKQQADKTAWRILKDWVEAQMALIESGQVELAQVFMPYATDRSGRTMYELFVQSSTLQLTDGEIA